MTVDRRTFFASSGGLAAGLSVAALAAASDASAQSNRLRSPASFVDFAPGRGGDVTDRLQRTIDDAASLGQPVQIAPGYYAVRGRIRLKPGTKLVGPNGLATFDLVGNAEIAAENAADILISGITMTGASNQRNGSNSALLRFNGCTNLTLTDLTIDTCPVDAVRLWQSSARIDRCRFGKVGHTAINTGNAAGPTTITHNIIRHVGNNGIFAWREKPGPDGTSITNNDIADIRTDAGGTGQNGNAINVFRADNVIVMGNTIATAAYSAIRCNAASNAQIIANNCRDIGEVALYAEFAFQGAVIANNVVDRAATGISVTNFNDGGRLATVQGNLIRNLFRREHEKVDKRGVGISVEADTVVSGNVIENAPTVGIMIGWGRYIRQVTASANIVRDASVGIGISQAGKAGTAMIANNVVSNAADGAVRLFDHDRPIGKPLQNGDSSGAPAVLNGNLFT